MENHHRSEIEISLTTILKAIGLLVALYIAYTIREVFLIFIVALFLSVLIDPFADWCERRKIPRAIAVLITYVGLIGAIVGIIVGLIPPITREFAQLMANSGEYVKNALDSSSILRSIVGNFGGEEALRAGLGALKGTDGGGGLFGTIQNVFGGFAAFALVLALAFYMVVEEAALRKFFTSVTPHRFHEYWGVILPRVQDKLGAWLRGQLILSLSIGVAVFIGLQLLGIKYALVLALLAGFSEFIPYVGPVVGATPAVFLAFAQSPVLGIATLIMYIVVQWCENHILVPKIMQKTIGINPIASILALLVGAKLGGLLGVILAIPITAAALVFIQDFFAREEAAQLQHQKL